MTDWNQAENIEIWDCACFIYDGGWRAEDRNELKEDFPDLPDDRLDKICEALEILEERNA